MDEHSRAHWAILGSGLVLAGIVHILLPHVLIRLAQKGYKRVLAVEFRPQATTARRIRLVGVGMCLAGLHLLYHRRVVPEIDGLRLQY